MTVRMTRKNPDAPSSSLGAHAGMTPGFHPGIAPAVATVAGLQGNLPLVLMRIIQVVLILAAVVALGFVVYGGFRYMAARGEQGEVEAAKHAITGGLIGLVVIGLAAAVVGFVVAAVLS